MRRKRVTTSLLSWSSSDKRDTGRSRAGDSIIGELDGVCPWRWSSSPAVRVCRFSKEASGICCREEARRQEIADGPREALCMHGGRISGESPWERREIRAIRPSSKTEDEP